MEAALEGSSGWAPILLAALSPRGRPGRGAALWLGLQCVSSRKARAAFPARGRLGGWVAQRPTPRRGVHAAGRLHPPALGLSAQKGRLRAAQPRLLSWSCSSSRVSDRSSAPGGESAVSRPGRGSALVIPPVSFPEQNALEDL